VRFTFDTNILVYAIDAKAGQRHSMAVEFVDRAKNGECILALQSLGEFFSVAIRKIGLDPKEAEEIVDDWRSTFPVIAADEDCLADAMWAVRQHRLSFWDAMLWAAAKGAGCRLLISEDFDDGQAIGPVTFVDPFQDHNAVLLGAALPAL